MMPAARDGARNDRLKILASCGLVHAVVLGGAYLSLPPAFEAIGQSQGWSTSLLLQAWSFIPLGSAVLAFASGYLINRFRDRWILAVSGLATLLSLLARASAQSPMAFAASLFVFGVATGAVLVVITNRVAATFRGKHAGMAQAVFYGCYSVGAASGMAGSHPMALALGSWRAVPLVWAGLSALSLVAAMLAPAAPASSDPAAEGPGPGAPTATTTTTTTTDWRRATFRYSAVLALYVGGYLGLVGILPLQLRRWGWDAATADLSLTLSSLGFLLGAPMIAAWTDRHGRRPQVFAACMLAAASMIVLLAAKVGIEAPSIARLAIAGIGFFSGCMTLFFPIVFDDPATGGERSATTVGIATAASYLGGFGLPFALAGFVDRHPEMVLLVCAAGFAAAGAGMVGAPTSATGAAAAVAPKPA